jgi:2-keto-4-pentenoate hydratase/2-oxohepta-3-ene-1,7-dioic acid hydratase in catechol pathway
MTWSYRLFTYRSPGNEARAGVFVGETPYDAGHLCDIELGRTRFDASTVPGLLAGWADAEPALAEVARKASARPSIDAEAALDPKALELLAPVPHPGQIYCAGANYRDHVEEMSRALGIPPEPDPHALGIPPWHFIKPSRTVVGPGADVPLPAYSAKVDWEAEIAAVIGVPARNVSVERALEHVAGYTIADDLSARDHVARAQVPEGSPFKFDWMSHKGFESSCPMGPWLVPARDVPDPQRLAIRLWVADELMQDSSSDQMIFSVAEQIAFLSTRITLHPGDVILTGTPAGVGTPRQRFLRPGETVRIEVERLGTLTHRMAAPSQTQETSPRRIS